MELSEIEKEIMEKASEPGGTNYSQHDWISKDDFDETIKKMVNEKLVKEERIVNEKDFIEISIYRSI